MANKKKMAMTLGAMALTAVIAIGGTLAYLQSSTGTKENKFTSTENITGETTETEWDKVHKDGWEFHPGEAAYKDPTIKLEGKEDAWIALNVKVIDKTTGTDTEITLAEFQERYGDIYYGGKDFDYKQDVNKIDYSKLAHGFNLTDWTELAEKPGMFMYNNTLKAGTSANTLFDIVKVKTGVYQYFNKETVTGTVYKYELDANGNKIEESKTPVSTDTFVSSEEALYDEKGNRLTDLKLPKFDIVISGYAVQANLDKAAAQAELIKLANSEN